MSYKVIFAPKEIVHDRFSGNEGDIECNFLYAYDKPKIPTGYYVQSITVERYELEKMIIKFYNIPYVLGCCTWRGDMAEFVYENL